MAENQLGWFVLRCFKMFQEEWLQHFATWSGFNILPHEVASTFCHMEFSAASAKKCWYPVPSIFLVIFVDRASALHDQSAFQVAHPKCRIDLDTGGHTGHAWTLPHARIWRARDCCGGSLCGAIWPFSLGGTVPCHEGASELRHVTPCYTKDPWLPLRWHVRQSAKYLWKVPIPSACFSSEIFAIRVLNLDSKSIKIQCIWKRPQIAFPSSPTWYLDQALHAIHALHALHTIDASQVWFHTEKQHLVEPWHLMHLQRWIWLHIGEINRFNVYRSSSRENLSQGKRWLCKGMFYDVSPWSLCWWCWLWRSADTPRSPRSLWGGVFEHLWRHHGSVGAARLGTAHDRRHGVATALRPSGRSREMPWYEVTRSDEFRIRVSSRIMSHPSITPSCNPLLSQERLIMTYNDLYFNAFSAATATIKMIAEAYAVVYHITGWKPFLVSDSTLLSHLGVPCGKVTQPLESTTTWFVIWYDPYSTTHRHAGILDMANVSYVKLYPFSP